MNYVRRTSYGPHSPVVGEKGARTRQAIIDAARSTFEVSGFHATSVEDIVDAAGVSRAALYQYFESKEQIVVELLRGAAADLLRVIRRLGPIGPTAAGYDNVHWWLGEWAWVQDKYRVLYLQAAVVDPSEASLRQLVADGIVSYVSALSPQFAAALGDEDDIDIDGVATVLLALLFRVNDYRQKGVGRGLSDDELLDALATFVQLALFPETPGQALTASTASPRPARVTVQKPRRNPRPWGRKGSRGGNEATSNTVQRILDAAATTFALRGFHATSVQDVLDAAGAGRGTFYKYFDDKTQLLERLAEQCMVRLEELAGRFLDVVQSDEGGTALRSWLEECLVLHRKYRGVLRVLLQEEARHSPLKELRLNSGAAILLAFDDALARVDRDYSFDVRVGSLVLLAFLERGPDYSFGTVYDLADDRIVDVLATLIERGLLGSARPRTGRRGAP